ncbi:hypothetical protein F5Y13DRAFT_199362 [Hypoxylon sp. FL1857]|nr:hypothetical protein F5Y13DRAFT_199362 [Hypoxylon sp. FL1857]
MYGQQRIPRYQQVYDDALRRATRGRRVDKEARRRRKLPLGGSAVPQGHILILQFAYHDFPEMPEITNQIQAAFQRIGFEVTDFRIPMRNPLYHLENKLAQFLKSGDRNTVLMIYYGGHGYVDNYGRGLMWQSHNVNAKFRAAPAHVAWRHIRKYIVAAERNVGIILDCCSAGAAVIPSIAERAGPQGAGTTAAARGLEYNKLQPRRGYQKEVIAAAGWGVETTGGTSKALCSVLNNWDLDQEDSLSVETLHERMVHFLAREGQDSQPVRWREMNTIDGRVRIPHIRQR